MSSFPPPLDGREKNEVIYPNLKSSYNYFLEPTQTVACVFYFQRIEF